MIGLEQGQEMNYLRQQFHIFIAGLISLPIKLPGTQLYRSLKVNTYISQFGMRVAPNF
jgi:steroid 3-oxidase